MVESVHAEVSQLVHAKGANPSSFFCENSLAGVLALVVTELEFAQQCRSKK